MTSKWETVLLGDLVTKRSDFTPVIAETKYEIVGIQRSGWGFVRREAVRGDSMKFSKLMQLEEGELSYRVITAFEAPSAVVDIDFAGSFVTPQTFPVFKLNQERITPGFMSLLTTSPAFHSEMAKRCSGTVLRRKTLSVGAFREITIELPSIVEQRRIVDVIGAMDGAIEAALTQVESSQRLLQQRRAALIGTGTADHVPAADAFEITMGRQRSPKHEQGDGMTPYLRSANIKPGTLVLDDVKIMNFSDREIEKFHLQLGDVLVTEGSGSSETVGAPAQWNNELASPVCFQNTLLRYRAINDVTIPDYVYHWCQWAFESGKFLDIASGTNIKHIGSTRAMKVPVQLHPLERQNEICDELEALENVAVSTKETEAALRTLRSEMLTSLLSGAHTIPESYDELLETVDA